MKREHQAYPPETSKWKGELIKAVWVVSHLDPAVPLNDHPLAWCG